MKLLVKIIINTTALLVVAYIVPGFKFASIQSVLVAAIVLGVINTFIRPILQIIALPISILTLGIFAFLINVVLLWIVSLIVPGFTIESFVTAAIASLLLTLVSSFLHRLAKE